MIPLLTFRKPPATFCRLQAGWAPATRMNDNTEILPLARTAREVSRFLETLTTTIIRWLHAQLDLLHEPEGIMLLDDIVGMISLKHYIVTILF